MSDGGPETHGEASRPRGPSFCPDGPSSAGGSPGSAATTPLFNGNPKRQLAGFVVATVGWILGTMSMGLAEWRVWYLNSTSLLPSRLACMGVWRACVFPHGSSISRAIGCHHYSHHDTYVLLDIRVAQNFLLIATILGLFGKAATVLALRNVFLRKVQNTCDPFAVAGMLNVAASACILVAVVWNHKSVKDQAGIAFPPSFNLPFKPDSQEVGGAALMACLGSFALFFGGLVYLSYKYPLDNQVHPSTSDT